MPDPAPACAHPVRRPLHRVLAGAAAGQLAVLLALDAAPGLGPAGWATATAVAVAGGALLARAAARARHRFGPADTLTLARCTLTAATAGLLADAAHPWAAVATAATALALDLADGPVARRTGTASEFGARFDMEADAFLLLVLSAAAAPLLGPWTLAIGTMRYAFAAAARWAPWLSAPLPPSRARKAVAAVQGTALVAALAPATPHPLAALLTAAALALLTWSFGRDIRWLHRHRT
ncbi:hypothetical protein SUDANB121_00688 [Nocardiopsis dassonvillei]|uniref:CDP-alcohol phosphatidyltransferase family protein n=1 Tax=Nocardiopsis dassonvillei TaxID=2014 RepID=UPI003F54F675